MQQCGKSNTIHTHTTHTHMYICEYVHRYPTIQVYLSHWTTTTCWLSTAQLRRRPDTLCPCFSYGTGLSYLLGPEASIVLYTFLRILQSGAAAKELPQRFPYHNYMTNHQNSQHTPKKETERHSHTHAPTQLADKRQAQGVSITTDNGPL